MDSQWYLKNTKIWEVMDSLSEIARSHDCKIKIIHEAGIGGGFESESRTITLSTSVTTSIRDVLSTFFHELGHAICYDQKKFWAYHSNQYSSDSEIFKRTALRAERYVDSIAEEQMAIYFPDIPYRAGYASEEAKDFLAQYFGWAA